ncbi:hypothetical protein J3A83DRAFT_2083345 [Scleroderma citrinum]
MDKEHLVRTYIEQQRAYLPAYRPVDLLETPSKKTDNRFGFDTPVLKPRKLQKSNSNKENETTTKKSPQRRKRKKTPPPSDEEREARLAERRERKRQKREIVKPPVVNVDDGGAACKSLADKAPNAKKKSRVLTPAAFALMHGFSAANVRKDRLTLKSGHLGVFMKGKASTKAKVSSSKKSAPSPILFSEFAFLNKPSQKVSPAKDDAGSERSHSSRSSQSSHSNRATDSRFSPKKDAECRKVSAPHTKMQDPLERPQSVVWDIKSQKTCPPGPVQSDVGATASVVLNLRSSHWFAPPDPENVHNEPVIHSKPSPPRQMKMPSRSHSLPGILEKCSDDQSSSLHPSHSASQAGYYQPCHTPEHVTFHSQPETSKYFSRRVEPSYVPDPRPSSAPGCNFQVLGTPDEELNTGHMQPVIPSFMDPSLQIPQSVLICPDPELLSGLSNSPVNELCHQPIPKGVRPFYGKFPMAQLMETASSASLEDDARGYYECIEERPADPYSEPIGCSTFDGFSLDSALVSLYESDDNNEIANDFTAEQDIDLTRDFNIPYDYDEELSVRALEQGAVGADSGHDLEDRLQRGCNFVEGGVDIDYFDDQYDDSNAFGNDDGFHRSDREMRSSVMDEDAEGELPLAPGLFEGRALLLGLLTSMKQQSGLSDAEVDVAKRLHGHWRPRRH